jgi:CRP-like cAMP-binding protein
MGNQLLAGLSTSDLALVQPHLEMMRLQIGRLPGAAGWPTAHVYFPHDAVIAVLAVTHAGEAIETAMIGGEGMVGAPSAAACADSALAVTCVAGSASRIAAAAFAQAMAASSRIRALAIEQNEMLLAQVQRSAACNARHHVTSRLARLLLQIRDRVDLERIPITQRALSDMLGVRRTTVNAAARSLLGAGLLRYARGRIAIVDPPALEARACDCYRVMRRGAPSAMPLTLTASAEHGLLPAFAG